MDDIFEGFGDLMSSEQETPSVPKQERPMPSPQPQDVSVSKKEKRLSETERAAYAQYAEDVKGLDDRYTDLGFAVELVKIADKKAEAAHWELKSVEADWGRVDQAAKSVRDELQKNLAVASAELERQKLPGAKTTFHLRKPELDGTSQTIVSGVFQRKLATKDQLEYVAMPVEQVCGMEKDITGLNAVEELEAAFASNDLRDRLGLAVPSDNTINNYIMLASAILAGVFLVMALMGGIQLAFIASILRVLCYILVFAVVGSIVTVVVSAIIGNHLSDTLSWIISAVLGFFVIGTSVASSASNWLVKLLTSGGFGARLIIGLIFAVIIFVGSLLLIHVSGIHKLVIKIPALKRAAIRETMKEFEKIENSNPMFYCILNHDAVCQFFASNYRDSVIRYIEDVCAKGRNNLNKLDQVEQRARAEAEKEISSKRNTYNEALSEKARKEQELQQKREDAAACFARLKDWSGQPDLDMISAYALQRELCFVGTAEANGVSVRTLGRDGLAVHYKSGKQPIEDVCVVSESVINAFVHMNPAALMDFAIINLADGSGGMRRYRRIDWLSQSTNTSGGVGTQTSGTVRLVDDERALRAYVGVLDELANDRDQYERSHENSLSQIAGNERFTTLEHVNTSKKAEGQKPLTYQIMLIVCDGLKNATYDKAFFDSLKRGIGDGYIPVFLVDDNMATDDRYSSAMSNWIDTVEKADQCRVDY